MTHRHGHGSAVGFHCRLCGETIGVYEPLVVDPASLPRTTSRAAEPWLDPSGVYYHSGCFPRRHGAKAI
jgi:hypothetical protein